MERKTSIKPHMITLRAYQVGFGDCFLLTFHYMTGGEKEEKRHVLIDFGTTARPDDAPKDLSLLIAEDIKEICDNKLHVVVATHRHADHISGFATGKDGKRASGDIIRDMKPDLVIQPWTEKWDAPSDATSIPTEKTLIPNEKTFLSALEDMNNVSRAIVAEADRFAKDKECNDDFVARLKFLGANNLGQNDVTNKSAVENLRTMGKNLYLWHGHNEPELETILPNVKVHVLGPPNLEQTNKIRAQRATDKDEFWEFSLLDEDDAFWQLRVTKGAQFWKLLSGTVEQVLGTQAPLFSGGAILNSPEDAPPQCRWLTRRLNSIRNDRLFRIVRTLDSVLNNTSLILLFEVGDQKLLFPGDAQIENWSYALKHPEHKDETERLLKDVTLYKVGHHGSRNATPKSLWELLNKNKEDRKEDRFESIVSTKAGKHGSAADNTEVPRETLVQELKRFKFFTTEDLVWAEKGEKKVPCEDFEFKIKYD